MKKQIFILWGAFFICFITTVTLWFAVNKSNPKYEEVQVKVLSSETKQVINRSTGTRYTTYNVTVDYNGKSYKLENAHNIYEHLQGKMVTAYFSNNRLFADINGVKSSTPIGTVYFIFLFASIILFFISLTSTGKLAQNKK